MARNKLELNTEETLKSILGTGTMEEEKETETENPEIGATVKGRSKMDRETKKRVSLSVYPSTYSDLQKIAYVNRQSVSDIVTELITKYIEDNRNKLKEYNELKSK